MYEYKKYKNAKEIKKCKIKINDIDIGFNYFHEFKEKGKYIIKYIFSNNLTNTNNIFSDCTSLTNINLSNFNTQNVINMASMFSGCNSLININLPNFNTRNVINMANMFSGYNSFNNINFFNFNTQNVDNMYCMFRGCELLKKENIITKDKNILNEIKNLNNF